MFSKIYTWIKSLASWLKVMLVFISFGAVVSSTLLVYKTKVLNGYKEELKREQQTNDLRETQEKLDTVIRSLDILSGEVNSFYPQLEITNSKVDYLVRSNENLKNYMILHALDKDGMLEVLDIWDVKKKLYEQRRHDSIKTIMDTLKYKITVKEIKK